MFATIKFRDAFATIDDGQVPGVALTASGTTSGKAIALGGTAPFEKFLFQLIAGSGSTSAGTVTFSLQTSTASGGTFASFSTKANSTAASMSIALSTSSKYVAYIEARSEMFADLGTTATWVKPVFAVSAVVGNFATNTLGFVSGNDPASKFDSSTVVVTELDLLY
jgi:hypothetical protein